MGIESKIKPKPKPKPETSESRRDFLKFLGFSTVYNPLPFINELAKINTNTDKETKNNIELSNFDPEKVFKEAQVLYTEYITSDDYMLRLKLLFFRADKFKDSKYIPGKSFEDTFGDFDAINIEFENLTTEEQRKYVSRAISFRAEKMEEVNNIEHKFFDKLSDDLERNEKTQASMINVESFKKILSKTKKSEQIEILNILYTPEVVEYILESINSPKIKNFIIIKNPDTTVHPNFFYKI